MKTNKITKRDHFNTLLEIVEKFNPTDEYDVDAIKDFIHNEIDILDRKAVSAKKAAAKKKAAPDALYDAVKEALNDEDFQPIANIIDAINPELAPTPQKVASRLTKMVNAEEVEKTELTLDCGEGQKKRKVQGYKLIG